MKICHNMNIIVQTICVDASSLNGKVKFLIRHLIISRELFFWTQATRKNFGVFHISMPYGSPAELRIYYVVMFPTYYGMEQDLHTNISKYGVWDSKSSIDRLQERILMIDPTEVISWDMQLLHDLFSTGNQIKLLLSTEPIMFGLINIIPAST